MFPSQSSAEPDGVKVRCLEKRAGGVIMRYIKRRNRPAMKRCDRISDRTARGDGKGSIRRFAVFTVFVRVGYSSFGSGPCLRLMICKEVEKGELY